MRSRAASMSASSGLANAEHLLEDLTNRGQRVELPLLHLGEQPLQLRVLAHRLLDLAARADRRNREHLVREVTAPALLELAFRVEPRAVLADLLPQLLD